MCEHLAASVLYGKIFYFQRCGGGYNGGDGDCGSYGISPLHFFPSSISLPFTPLVPCFVQSRGLCKERELCRDEFELAQERREEEKGGGCIVGHGVAARAGG